MKKVILASFAIATTMSCMAQNSVTISQTGGSGNTASVQQTGSGSRVIIKQQSSGDTAKASINHLRIEVPVGTRTTIHQAGHGPNVLEISQGARPSAIIQQHSTINENTITEIQPKEPPKSKYSNPRKKP